MSSGDADRYQLFRCRNNWYLEAAPALEAFFTDRLMTQRAASPHTIASYRDTFRLLLGYTRDQHGTQPARLDLADLDAPVIGGFLTWLETARGNSAATRNNRLAAIHSLFRYAALDALLAAPDRSAWNGRRDHALLTFAA